MLRSLLAILSISLFSLPVESGWLIKKASSGGSSYSSYIDLDGTSDRIHTTDSAGNSVTGSLDIIAKISAADWTPTAKYAIVSKFESTGSNRSYLLELSTSGELVFVFSTSGGNGAKETITSSASVGFTDGTAHWVRATFNTSTTTVQFFTSSVSGYPGSWTQLGTDQSTTGAAIYDGTAPLELGASNTAGESFMDGEFYYAEVLDGIGGTTVAQFDASSGTDPTYDNVGSETDWTNAGGTPGP